MDATREYMNRPITAGVVGFIIGAIFGLVILGWWLFPVSYTNAFPEHLRDDYREDYLRMAIDSYSVNPDPELANFRFAGLGEDAEQLLANVAASPGSQDPAAITQFSLAVQAQPTVPGGEVTPPEEEGGSLFQGPLLVLCGLTLVLAVALAAIFFIRRQQSPAGEPMAAEDIYMDEVPEMAAPGEEPPLAQFMTTYMIGDDLFDDSFSVDSPAGEFLGECGIGIAETIGVGDPKKVSSFEVWLFDKNDIQTVTKVLMSAHTFGDEATRQRLAAKGEPVLGEPGSQIILETATLRLIARVVDMSYGEGALPPESFFDRLTLELAVWPKA